MTAPNRLYFGDCLTVMREDIPDESVDLIYLDPPFNSKRLYNAFIGDAQWVAFDDTWRWYEAIDDFDEVARQPQYAGLMEGLRMMLGEGSSLAYLSYMANRLLECRRVLKPTGSIYLHCDPTFSHYLKALMDGLFGGGNFINEISWRRSQTRSSISRKFRSAHDVILFYGGKVKRTFEMQYRELSDTSKKIYNKYDERGRYRLVPLLVSGIRKGKTGSTWCGIDPNTRGKNGMHWVTTPDKLKRYDAQQLIYWPNKSGGAPNLKYYLSDSPGVPLSDFWDDIPLIQSNSPESLGYPTQKPLTLLHRILSASSKEGDVILDPFCGCGTAIHAAQNLNRRWIGIDICVNACKIIEKRLRQHFDSLWSEVDFVGFPRTLDHARTLADIDKFRFERWAAALVDGMEPNKRQRGDGGIDGWGRIAIRKGTFIDMVSQVKGGSTSPGDVQAFNGARQQAGADLGIFTCFDDRVTTRMREAAVSAGRFMETPRVQIYTIEDYFEGRRPRMPIVA